MRFPLALGLLAALAAPAAAQDAPAASPHPESTFVVPSHPGEAVRVTTYAARPTGPGRLAARYRGLRVNRTAPVALRPVRALVVEPVLRTPRAAFVERAGSRFQIVPAR
jgi:hypothetical protein